MTEVFSEYPLIADTESYLRGLTPGVMTQPNAWAMTDATLRVLGDLDGQQMEMIRQMDPALATGALLDYCGSRVFEGRGGLGDTEYRLVIAGRTAANFARGTVGGVWSTWLAVSGASADRARMLRWGPDDEPVIMLWAEYDFVPSVPFLRRAGQVMLDAVAFPFDVVALLLPAGSLRFDGLPGFDAGTIPYQLHTVRA